MSDARRDLSAPSPNYPPQGHIIWDCPHCGRRYITSAAPATCPFCLRPVKSPERAS